MNTGKIREAIPIIRDVINLGMWVADRIRARRAKRKAAKPC